MIYYYYNLLFLNHTAVLFRRAKNKTTNALNLNAFQVFWVYFTLYTKTGGRNSSDIFARVPCLECKTE